MTVGAFHDPPPNHLLENIAPVERPVKYEKRPRLLSPNVSKNIKNDLKTSKPVEIQMPLKTGALQGKPIFFWAFASGVAVSSRSKSDVQVLYRPPIPPSETLFPPGALWKMAPKRGAISPPDSV
jgi:hypothetical protein